MTELKEIGERLRAVRAELGLSQRALAELLGITHSTYSTWELGKTGPSATTLMYLCGRGYNGHWLLTGHGTMTLTVNEDDLAPQSHRTAIPPQTETTFHPATSPAEETAQALAQLESLSKGGSSGKAWAVMQALLDVYPATASMDDLMTACGQEKSELLGNLLFLKRLESIEEMKGHRYRLSTGSVSEKLAVNSSQERFDLAFQAANAIVHDVLPAMASSQGRITLMKGRFQAGVGASLLEELGKDAIARVEKAGSLPGESESITVLVAVAVDSGKD